MTTRIEPAWLEDMTEPSGYVVVGDLDEDEERRTLGIEVAAHVRLQGMIDRKVAKEPSWLF